MKSICYVRQEFQMPNDSFGYKLKMLRSERHLTKKDFCSSLNIAKNTLIRYERGISYPTLNMLKAISQILDVNESVLYDDYYNFVLNFGSHVKSLRLSLHLNQKEFAKLFGSLGSSTVHDWENNKHYPTQDIIKKIMLMCATM